MTLRLLSDFLLWCMALNYAVLLCWFLAFSLGHSWLRRLHGRWFRLSDERFDAIHYACMALYKLGILLLNLVPYIALRIVGGHAA